MFSQIILYYHYRYNDKKTPSTRVVVENIITVWGIEKWLKVKNGKNGTIICIKILIE